MGVPVAPEVDPHAAPGGHVVHFGRDLEGQEGSQAGGPYAEGGVADRGVGEAAQGGHAVLCVDP